MATDFFRFWRGIYSTGKRELEKNIWLYGLIGIAVFVHMYMLFHDTVIRREIDVIFSMVMFDLVFVLSIFLIGCRVCISTVIGVLDFLLHFYCILTVIIPEQNYSLYQSHFINLIFFSHSIFLIGTPFYRRIFSPDTARWVDSMVTAGIIILNFIVEIFLLINQSIFLFILFHGR